MEETGQDRISSPDNLIHHILSFIDMKYAVQTSILSKRWKTTWISLPYLNFTWSDFIEGCKDNNLNDPVSRSKQLDRFVDFVCMVFMLRDDSDIQKFMIYLDWTAPVSDEVLRNLTRWILAAVGRNVAELIIISDNDAYELPHALLNCKSLRKLWFFGSGTGRIGNTHTKLIVPKSMGLLQLKDLVLVGVSISCAELTQRLTSCPLLNSLFISYCDLRSDNQQNCITDSLSPEIFGYYGRNLSLHYLTMANNIKLSAPNLVELDFTVLLTQEYSLEIFPSVVHAIFRMILKHDEKDETAETYLELPAEERKVYAIRVVKFLQTVPNVRELTLSPGLLEVLSNADDLLDFRYLHFSQLQCLEMDIWLTRGCLRSIAYLVKISPNIKSIFLTSKEANSADVGDDWEAGLTSPQMLSHLESVEIKEVEGCDTELKLLSFLLKNAKVLKKLCLFTRSTVGSPDREQVNRIKDALSALATSNSHIKASYYVNDVQLAEGDP